MKNQQEILLESGTNELEIIQFKINNHIFGINVLKVKEIILPSPTTPIPHSHPYLLGIVQLRGEVLPVVSLERALGMERESERDSSQDKFIVTEFNSKQVVFHVHNVDRILRISWDKIEKPSNLYALDSSNVIGVIKEKDEMILMLDFEKIMVDINPEAGIHPSKLTKIENSMRREKRLIVVEDSPLLRQLLGETLTVAGYEQIEFFENGRDALNHLESLVQEGKDILKEVQLVITDIEMPQMDGHHLTRRLKENPHLSGLPIIIFSSLITEDLFHRGQVLGAVDQIAKPEIDKLVAKIDQYIL
ncbi:chemotaxis protein [Lederbergia galactosidilytica]|uniref:Chemotaxis protein CheV n=1 Tax=Lederbergia galactosidilytica TaxID=217031 RepID=A0A177ZYM8_9BACI|nr:chemotaxis protein [Lederbergia galactosidilytica]KRG16036.1 chemotaxis protein CheV [Virgibacillus soli]MBP1915601.1 two-component system chemotaxis response regulator CheV [Lederbergia galactosidilytica]OAK73001.1 chemotaxis protein CheV [Lederbergia galactosidilytica]